MEKKELNFTVNRIKYNLMIKPNETLLDVLRNKLGLKGTKRGCDKGECGACTVVKDGDPVASCQILALQTQGSNILTIEGLAEDGELHPLQESFIKNGAIQCGFCTPGMILSAKCLLDENPNPTRDEIKKALSGNLCRCTGYEKILRAVEQLVKE